MKIRVAELIVILELCVVLVHFTNGEVSLTGRSEALYAVNKVASSFRCLMNKLMQPTFNFLILRN